MIIAVYGTLKSQYGNNSLMRGSTLIGEGLISGHRLFQNGIPFLVKDQESDYSVLVEVYDVPEQDVPRIDSLEGHPRWYRREPTAVQMKSGEVQVAEIYKLDTAPDNATENLSGVF